MSMASAKAEPAGACATGLPPSAMMFMDAKFAGVEEIVDAETLAAAKGRSSGHAGEGFLLADPSVRGWLTVEHRVVRSPTDPTVFCNAPHRVRVALGFGERRLLVSAALARNRCVMDALRGHEALHAQAEERELGVFIDSHSPAVGQAMAMLKSAPASSADMAKQQFEGAGLPLVRALEKRLLFRKAELRLQVDTPHELSGMAAKCDGAVGEFEAGGAEAI